MDTTRYETLTAKRDGVGLSDEEADELGRMIAELEGRAYANADTVRVDEDGPVANAESPCGHLGCRCMTSGSFCSDFCRGHAEGPNDAGPEFDCGCGHDACKTVVGEG